MASPDFGALRVSRARAAARVGIAALVALAGCRTRLYDLVEPAASGEAGAAADGATGDAAPPLYDLTIPRDNCGDYTIQTTTIVRADLLLVQDRSGSMNQGVHGERNPPAGQSKWELVRAAIEQVVAGTAYVDWGLMLFGLDRGCGAPVAPNVPVGPGSAATIHQVLDATVANASTPTTATLRNAVAWFAAFNDGHPHYLMLATDGQPTCANGVGMRDDSVAAIREVGAAAAAGVKTFVVGIGASTGADNTLNAMADSGQVPNTTPGQPHYYPVTSTQDLVAILQKAAIQITPCAYPVEHVPPDPNRVLIQSVRGVIPRDPTHQNGWDFSGDDKQFIFYGAACDELRGGTITSVETVYGCPGD